MLFRRSARLSSYFIFWISLYIIRIYVCFFCIVIESCWRYRVFYLNWVVIKCYSMCSFIRCLCVDFWIIDFNISGCDRGNFCEFISINWLYRFMFELRGLFFKDNRGFSLKIIFLWYESFFVEILINLYFFIFSVYLTNVSFWVL